MSLYALTGRPIDQARLAQAMYTDDPVSGTRLNNAQAVLNHYARPFGYRYIFMRPQSPDALHGELLSALRAGLDPLIGVIGDELPWHTAAYTNGDHELLAEGLTRTGKFIVEDPEPSDYGGGAHAISSRQLYDAMREQAGGPQHGRMIPGVGVIMPSSLSNGQHDSYH